MYVARPVFLTAWLPKDPQEAMPGRDNLLQTQALFPEPIPALENETTVERDRHRRQENLRPLLATDAQECLAFDHGLFPHAILNLLGVTMALGATRHSSARDGWHLRVTTQSDIS